MSIIQVTSVADSGAGSLREAIANSQAGDTIKFNSALANQKIVLTSGEVNVLKDVTIDGSDAPNLVISGNNQTRILRIGDQDNRINVTVKNVKFVEGRAVAGTTSDGDIAEGGAIKVSNFSDLIVENSTFQNNIAERSGAIQIGFGGSGTIRNSTFDGNDGSIAGDGFSAGAISTYGSGGIPNFDPGNGFLKIEGSTFTNNKGNVGGAVYSLLGPLTIEDSNFKNNESTGDGGAVFTDGADKSNTDNLGGEIIIRRTNIEGNKARGHGGGLFLWTYNPDRIEITDSSIIGNSTINGGSYNDSKGGGIRVNSGFLTIRNTTIANNTSQQQGGGVWIDGSQAVDILNSTFSGNIAQDDMGGAITMHTSDNIPVRVTNNTFVNNSAGRYSGAIWSDEKNSDNITLTNNLFAGNTAYPQQMHTNYQLNDGGGNFVERNPIDQGPRVTATATYVDDLNLSNILQKVGDDLMYVLDAGSPAINGGTPNGATAYDQRGVQRDSQPDAGAFEFVPSLPVQVASPISLPDNSALSNNTTGEEAIATVDSSNNVSDPLNLISSPANNTVGGEALAPVDSSNSSNNVSDPLNPISSDPANNTIGGEAIAPIDSSNNQLDGGTTLVPSLIKNDNVQEFLKNPAGNPIPLLSQGVANPNHKNHDKVFNNNHFGFEDHFKAKNPHFNDFAVGAKR